ncbi:hypothetical protein ACVGVM_15745 [Pseudonocardia bannensis]|uniref:Uncharacterized protein n=1 Tax=Pseudonocardia bannensis TaxID=630973 RepID=A0A848DEH0_9PSEU|nr:hypothetical protein [Pseudonocardia bannensis]NMH90965.1 hypothetical protein [Pseudonocardia bannensis]
MTRSDAPRDQRSFDVVAWMSERRMVLYVPEIEAATSVRDMADADDAARDLIAELTGLDAASISCDIRLGRPGGGPVGPAEMP